MTGPDAEGDQTDVVTDHPSPTHQPVAAAGITREAHIAWA